jgi:hypothetical protein
MVTSRGRWLLLRVLHSRLKLVKVVSRCLTGWNRALLLLQRIYEGRSSYLMRCLTIPNDWLCKLILEGTLLFFCFKSRAIGISVIEAAQLR